MKVMVQLIITSINWTNGEKFFFTKDMYENIFPSFFLKDNEDPNDIARDLFEKYVDIDKNWADINISSAVSLKGDLVLTYSTSIPINSGLKAGRMVPFDSSDQEFVEDIKKSLGKIQ